MTCLEDIVSDLGNLLLLSVLGAWALCVSRKI
jgi:hypothetical protein